MDLISSRRTEVKEETPGDKRALSGALWAEYFANVPRPPKDHKMWLRPQTGTTEHLTQISSLFNILMTPAPGAHHILIKAAVGVFLLIVQASSPTESLDTDSWPHVKARVRVNSFTA